MLKQLTTGRIFMSTIVAIFVTLAYGFSIGSSGSGFDEGGLGTYASIVLLALCSAVSFRTYGIRRKDMNGEILGAHVVWIFMGAGFAYLALDDALMIHENLDKKIHLLLGLTETRATDRIDDFLILFYGLLGVSVLYKFRNEILRVPSFVKFMKIGFALMCVMVLLDAFGSGKAVEETFKLLAEATLLAGLTTALRHVSATKAAKDYQRGNFRIT